MTKDKKKEVDAEEPELYVEPPKLTGRDTAGVALALIALAIIGVAGYIWLNPQLNAATLFKRQPPAAVSAVTAPQTAPDAKPGDSGNMPGMDMSGQAADQSAQSSAATPPEAAADQSAPSPAGAAEDKPKENAAAEAKPEHFICDQCGMFADTSRSYIIAQWTDGMSSHHDSWDCVFKYGKANKMTLASAKVLDFSSPTGTPAMLDASGAWYLYKTKENITGSMPPNVAAYASKASAEQAQPSMGGEVVDFAGLKSKWE